MKYQKGKEANDVFNIESRTTGVYKPYKAISGALSLWKFKGDLIAYLSDEKNRLGQSYTT